MSGTVTYCAELSRMGIPTPPISMDYISDFGHVNYTIPSCVVLPRDAIDVQEIISLARKFQVPISVRGKASSTAGQTQSKGIVIDTSSIQKLELTENGKAIKLGAGVSWYQASYFVDQITNSRFRLAFAPDYVSELNVGGIVSVGGFGSFSLRSGSVLDKIEEIEVVTGTGDFLIANSINNTDIFFATKGGLGQFSVLISVTIPLVPLVPINKNIDAFNPFAGIPESTARATIETCKLLELPNDLPYTPHIMTYTLLWTNPSSFYDDLAALTKETSADGFESFLLPNSVELSPMINLLLSPLAVSCLIQKGIIGNSKDFPYLYFAVISDLLPLFDVAKLPGIVSKEALIVQGSPLPWVNIPGIKGYMNSSTFYGFEPRHIPLLDFLKNFPFWSSPKYNFNMFLPFSSATKQWFVKLMTETLPLATTIHPNVFFMIDARAFLVDAISSENLLQLPREKSSDFVFHPLVTMYVKNCDTSSEPNAATYSPGTSVPTIPVGNQCASDVDFMSLFTDQLYSSTLHQFQKVLPRYYPIGGVPYPWKQHYGTSWDNVRQLKCKYDPDIVLGSGVGVFTNFSCVSNDIRDSATIPKAIPIDPSNPSLPQNHPGSSLGLILGISIGAGAFLIFIVIGSIYVLIRRNSSGIREVIVESDSVQL